MIWFAVNFTENVEKSYVDGKHKHTVDATTATAVGKLLRASIIITGVLMLLQAFGFSISGVLALGGVGGIAIGFAARSLLANFFGALMIFLDRPFSVGDWIRSPTATWRVRSNPLAGGSRRFEPSINGPCTCRTRSLPRYLSKIPRA